MPRSRDYDLRTRDGIDRALADGRPEVVIHLAAVVGGIGANRENPGRFFYENAIMGIQLMEQARLRGRREVRRHRHRLRLPQVHPGARSARTTSGTATRRRPTRPTAWPRRCCSCRARPTAQQYGFNAIYLLPVNLYGPRRQLRPRQLARDPGADQEVRGRARARRRPHRGLGHRQRPRASSSTSRTRREGIVLAAERYDGAEPVNLGVGQRDHDPRPGGADRAADRLRRARSAGTRRKPDGQPRRALDTSRARERFGFVAGTSFEEGLRATRSGLKASEPSPRSGTR